MIPLSILIPVKNDAKNLAECLPLLTEFDDVQIVDSQSTDETAEIAAKWNRPVVQFHWNGQFPKKRNWALRNLTFKYPWVLFLDADERMTPAWQREMSEFLNSECLNEGVAVVSCVYDNWFAGRLLKHGDAMRKTAVVRVGAAEYEKIDEDHWSNLDMEIHEHLQVLAENVKVEGQGWNGERLLNAETQRRRAEEKVEEWLAGVDEATFSAALENLVAEKLAAGEYRFKKEEERGVAIEGAKRFFAEFSRKIVPLSDGRCVYFAPDARAKTRNGRNAVSWAEYAFHAVSIGGVKLTGKDYHERWYNPHKIPAFASIVSALTAEHCFVRLSGVVKQDAIVFAGAGRAGESVQVVTRLDETGNMDANLSEVTFTSTRKGQKKLPRLVPLTEAVRTVVHHQTTAGSYSPDKGMIANSSDSRKGDVDNSAVKLNLEPQPSSASSPCSTRLNQEYEIKARLEHHDKRSLESHWQKHIQYADWETGRYRQLLAHPERWEALTPRQKTKYRNITKWWLAPAYFVVCYILKRGFLDGLAGLRFALFKLRYFWMVREKIVRAC